MTKNHILGLDIAQTNAVAQLERSDGTRCWRGSLSSDQAGWQALEQALAGQAARLTDTLVLIEATGVYHLAWAERLTQAGAEVYVLNPLLAARLESVGNALRGHKTDRVDAARLCEAGRLHAAALARFRYQPRPEQQGLKQLDHARGQLRRNLTNLRKSLTSQLELVFPALLQTRMGAWSARVARILARAPTAGSWLALPEAERQQLARDKQPALDQASVATLAAEPLALACVPAVLALLHAEQALAAQLEACDVQIAPRLPAAQIALITSLPGFGERIAAVLATYLPPSFAGWGARKQIVARLQAFFGFDPRLCQSGQWTGVVRLSKRGVVAARTALFQAAFCSLKSDPENAAYYARLRSAGKSHKQAIVDLMRKQLRRLVAVLCSQQPFVPKSLSPA